jgi:putative tryptophan/tyrosine transport system substrate-binding protein
MRRRELMFLLGGAMTAARGLRAQQKAMPVIGYLSQLSPTMPASVGIAAAFRQGLKEEGYVEGQNVAIESRFAEGRIDRLPALASDLVQQGVSVFVAVGGTGSVVNARPVVPRTIPIVFAMGGDPVELGIVASLARPGDNITGVTFLLSELAPKEVELLHELIPKATAMGFLVNPNDSNYDSDTKAAQAAASVLGHELVIVKASNASEIAPAFDALAQQTIKAVFVNADPLFSTNFPQIRELAARTRWRPSLRWKDSPPRAD